MFLYLLEVRRSRHRHELELEHSDVANLLVNARFVRLVHDALPVDKVLLVLERDRHHLLVLGLGLLLLGEELRHVLLELLGLEQLVVHGIDLGQEALLLLSQIHTLLRCELLPRLLLRGVQLLNVAHELGLLLLRLLLSDLCGLLVSLRLLLGGCLGCLLGLLVSLRLLLGSLLCLLLLLGELLLGLSNLDLLHLGGCRLGNGNRCLGLLKHHIVLSCLGGLLPSLHDFVHGLGPELNPDVLLVCTGTIVHRDVPVLGVKLVHEHVSQILD